MGGAKGRQVHRFHGEIRKCQPGAGFVLVIRGRRIAGQPWDQTGPASFLGLPGRRHHGCHRNRNPCREHSGVDERCWRREGGFF